MPRARAAAPHLKDQMADHEVESTGDTADMLLATLATAGVVGA